MIHTSINYNNDPCTYFTFKSFLLLFSVGLEETLDIIKNADANSNCAIFAPTLEKLLTILDARHLWGNYHPAMGLKAKIEKLDGANEGNIVIILINITTLLFKKISFFDILIFDIFT